MKRWSPAAALFLAKFVRDMKLTDKQVGELMTFAQMYTISSVEIDLESYQYAELEFSARMLERLGTYAAQ